MNPLTQNKQFHAEIDAAHPWRTGDHDTYQLALKLVGERHDKYELVDLVNWLLKAKERLERAERERDEAIGNAIKGHAEIMLALLEDRPIGGEYIHAVHCNASRREPVGNDMCSCRIGKRIKQIRAERDRFRAAALSASTESEL